MNYADIEEVQKKLLELIDCAKTDGLVTVIRKQGVPCSTLRADPRAIKGLLPHFGI